MPLPKYKVEFVGDWTRVGWLPPQLKQDKVLKPAAAKVAKPYKPHPNKKTERNADIVARRQASETLEAIAKDYQLTRERVRQIVKLYGP